MKKMFFFFSVMTLITFVSAQRIVALDNKLAGRWQGTLKVQAIELRVVFNIHPDSTGVLHATMDSPDQGAKGIPVDDVSIHRDTLLMSVKIAAGSYKGLMQAGDSIIVGQWSQGGLSLPLALHRQEQIAEVRRPQEPKPPFPYDAEDISYVNSEAGDTLAGTFTKPKAGSPFPALLLITGSGAQNRDEEIFGHKPFFVLADDLTRRGIAVLRVDDRGVGKSTGVFKAATTRDFAGDVRAGIRYLKSRKDVNTKKIGLLGHSEGGLIAPMVASDSKDIAFIVLLAGPSIPGDEILCLQDSLISAAMGAPAEAIHQELQHKRVLYSLVKSESDTATLAEKIRSLVMESMPADSTQGGQRDTSAVSSVVRQLTSPWFRFFLRYDPAPALESLTCPVLAVNGEKDLQVPAKENIDGMNRAFKKGGNTKSRAIVLPGLNHLFQKAETGAPLEYGRIEETINPEALRVIGEWIVEVTK